MYHLLQYFHAKVWRVYSEKAEINRILKNSENEVHAQECLSDFPI